MPIKHTFEHAICECDSDTQTHGDWSTARAQGLIKEFSSVQLRSGLYEHWAKAIDNLIENYLGGEGTRRLVDNLQHARGAELPLGISVGMHMFDRAVEGDVADANTHAQDAVRTLHHVGYEYGLMKVNPTTGRALTDSSIVIGAVWTYGENSGQTKFDEDFRARHAEIFPRYVQAFREAGIVVKDCG